MPPNSTVSRRRRRRGHRTMSVPLNRSSCRAVPHRTFWILNCLGTRDKLVIHVRWVARACKVTWCLRMSRSLRSNSEASRCAITGLYVRPREHPTMQIGVALVPCISTSSIIRVGCVVRAGPRWCTSFPRFGRRSGTDAHTVSSSPADFMFRRLRHPSGLDDPVLDYFIQGSDRPQHCCISYPQAEPFTALHTADIDLPVSEVIEVVLVERFHDWRHSEAELLG
ncbi:unnamed protein product [Mycena citricolor]|uniref:Uncharacterized protein n=1 Tax=Mycena citricolor TaxID=2018698 RepID=A0AAD2K047_9AGAR|nr:unnamed protein product [Mycena citricolor]